MVKSLSRLSFFFVLGLAFGASGCSRQGMGERCSLANGNEDCEGDLVCTDSSKLRNKNEVDRCCPEQLSSSDNSLCAQVTIGGGDGDGDGDGDSGSVGGNGGSSDTGDAELGDACTVERDCAAPAICSESRKVCAERACDWSSDCPQPFICGPRGVCQVECKDDRDCGSGEVCSSQSTCVAQ